MYNLREHSRARRVTITVKRDGSVWVTKPRRVSLREVERFIAKSAAWVEKARARMGKLPKTSRIETPAKQYKRYQKAASDKVRRRLKHFNMLYRFPYRNISIRNQKSRWGSCSRSGNLSFNYRILFLPEHLADYIIVHEICHLKELNHSKGFWSLVAVVIPDHKERRRELRALERGLLVNS